MGQISKETFKKLVLLYLVSKFKDGIYTSYRFQKILYFSSKVDKSHPFTFHHTQNGQYSYNARRIQDSLVWINLLVQEGLPEKEDEGAKWTIPDNDVGRTFATILPRIAPDMANSINQTIKECGYLKSGPLVQKAEADDLLVSTPYGGTLLEENIPNSIEIPLSDDECEEIELALNDRFLISMHKIVDAIETTDFDLGKVKRVASIL